MEPPSYSQEVNPTALIRPYTYSNIIHSGLNRKKECSSPFSNSPQILMWQIVAGKTLDKSSM